jgi:hypothetical protein
VTLALVQVIGRRVHGLLTFVLVASVGPLGALGAQNVSAAGPPPALRAGALRGALKLDGRLDEPAWASTDSIAALTEIEPNEGASPSGRTVVRVITTSSEIIFGIRADDPLPSSIVSFARERDAPLGNEDHLKIVLDTYLDGRSGYVFAVNPNGARYDALVADQGEGENSSWDAVWEAATARTATGWSAEIRIPLRSLLFRPGLREWGFNMQRRVTCSVAYNRCRKRHVGQALSATTRSRRRFAQVVSPSCRTSRWASA